MSATRSPTSRGAPPISPAAVEGRMVSANSAGADRIQGGANEIGELGGLVRQLAASVANHDDMIAMLRASGVAAAAAQPAKSDNDAPKGASAPHERPNLNPAPP